MINGEWAKKECKRGRREEGRKKEGRQLDSVDEQKKK